VLVAISVKITRHSNGKDRNYISSVGLLEHNRYWQLILQNFVIGPSLQYRYRATYRPTTSTKRQQNNTTETSITLLINHQVALRVICAFSRPAILTVARFRRKLNGVTATAQRHDATMMPLALSICCKKTVVATVVTVILPTDRQTDATENYVSHQ